MIEWQSESSLFLVRIRARQWYWIYKFDLNYMLNIFSIQKNLGRNRWIISSFGDLVVLDDYIHVINFRLKNKVSKNYLTNIFDKLGLFISKFILILA